MPTTFTPLAGAGIGAVAVIIGGDAQGKIALTTGIGCLLGDVVGTLIFEQPYTGQPLAAVIIVANDQSTIQIANNFVPPTSINANGFDIKNVGLPLMDNTLYVWYYKIF